MTESQYDEVVNALTDMHVALVDVNGEYRDTYDIFKDIAAQWDDMSSMEQAALATKLSGTRMQAVFYSLVQNFGEAEKAYQAMGAAEGELEEKNRVYAESMQGRITQFKNDFAALAQEIFRKEWVTDAVDMAKTVLSWIAKIAEALVNVVKALGGIKVVLPGILMLWGGFKIAKGVSTLTALANGIQKATEAGRALTGIQSLLVKGGYDAAASGTKLTAVLSSLTQGIAATTAAWIASPFGMATVAIAGIALTAYEVSKSVTAVDAELQKAKESQTKRIEGLEENLKNAKTEYQTVIQSIDDINNQLETNRSKIEDIKNLGPLNYIQQDELNRLTTTNDELERQLSILRATKLIADDAKREGLVDLMSVSTTGGQTKHGSYIPSDAEAFFAERYPEYARYFSNETEVEGYRYSGNPFKPDTLYRQSTEYSVLDFYNNFIEKIRLGVIDAEEVMPLLSKMLEDITTDLNGLEWVKNPTTPVQKKANEYILALQNIQDYLLGVFGQDDGHLNAFRRLTKIYGFDSYDEYKAASDRFSDSAYDFRNALSTTGFNLNNIEEAFEIIAAGKQQTDDTTDSLTDFAKVLRGVSSASSGLDILSKIFADIQDAGTFDYSALVDEKFVETFGGLGEVYDNFIQTVANSPSDIEACRSAFNELTQAFILQSGALDDVDENTKDVAIAMLEEKGVANASALVNAVLATSLYNVALEKYKVNDIKLDTEDDVRNLMQLASAAHASAEYMAGLTEILGLMQKLSDMPIGSQQWLAFSDRIEELKEGLTNLSPKDLTLPDASISFNGPGDDSDGGGTGNTGSGTTKTWFDEQLAYHKHLVAMEREANAQYFDWLEQAYKQAYAEGILSLDDYRKYEEEVFKGRRDLFKDHISDIENEISFREQFDGEGKAVANLLDREISDIEKEIAAARARGLDNNSDYIQELIKSWTTATDKRKKLEEDASNNAQSALDKLVELRRKMLEQDVADQKEALNDELDNLRNFYDKQKKMLQDSYDEEDYLAEQAEKRKSVSALEEELARLRYDDSAWAQKRKAELSQQITDARKELDTFERDHARDEALSFLDDQQEKAEEKINKQLDVLDEKTKSARDLYNQALEDIKNGSVELYREMIAWNAEYGDGIDDTITDAWNNAYGAVWNYSQLVGKVFKGVNLANAGGWTPNLKPSGIGYASGTYYAVPGLHEIDELGDETYFSASTGKKYKMFSGGEKVLNAKASDFLYKFANGGVEMLKRFIASVGGGVLNDRPTPLMTNNEIVMGDIIVNGNTDRATVSEIRRAQRESVEFMLKEFGKLNR